jgi:hypothetical protein
LLIGVKKPRETSRVDRIAPAQSNGTPDRLLADEDPDTIRPRDASYWITIYREMVGFKKQLLAKVKTDLQNVSPAARIDLAEDVVLIESQLARYERRLTFWSDRAIALGSVEGGDRS